MSHWCPAMILIFISVSPICDMTRFWELK
jgi:hypothetical protein